jgi:hypothetical protein
MLGHILPFLVIYCYFKGIFSCIFCSFLGHKHTSPIYMLISISTTGVCYVIESGADKRTQLTSKSFEIAYNL